MKKQFLYSLICTVMLSTLFMASCTGDKPEESTKTDIQYDDPDLPKYGGIHYRIRTANWNTWDYVEPPYVYNISLMAEELLGGDWSKGPAGTGANDWTSGYGGFTDTLTGRLAESWEFPDSETIIFHIRQGIHWWDREPANGRELIAQDVVWNIERQFTSAKAFFYNAYTKSEKGPLSVTATDDYTVEIKVLPEMQGTLATVIGDHLWLLCPDAVEANNGQPLSRWQQFIGTGPFMMSKYTEDSSIEYVKNPDYWQTDPLHPENQLPYAAGMREVIITSPNERQVGAVKAAFVTGQADWISTITMTIPGWEEVEHNLEKYPELHVKEFAGPANFLLWPRLDNDKLPFDEIRVRYAMNLAVNQQELIDDYYGGHAKLLTWPYSDLPMFDRIYIPLEEQSQKVQEIFGYDVERALELMEEAGYPKGFDFKIYSGMTDFLMIIKEYLRVINIDLNVNYMNEMVEQTHDDALFGYTDLLNPWQMSNLVEGNFTNYSRVSDTRIQETYDAVMKNYVIDNAEVTRLLKEIGPYELEQAFPIYLPAPNAFVMWWPWFQNYYGAVGGGGYDNRDEYLMYFWIDTEMKAAMGY